MIHLKLYAVLRFIIIALILATLSGCASMFNPYLEVEKCPANNEGSDKGSDCLSDARMSDAISYAGRVKNEYRDALGDEAKFSNVLGVGLIAVGAATLGLGITGAGTTAITVLGLTGTTGYGIGSWLENKPRQQAYIMGYNATNCAIEAVLPLHFEKENPLYKEFVTAYGKIDDDIESVEKQLGVVNKAISQESNPDTITRANANVTAAESVVSVSKDARTTAVSLQREIDIAGGNLFMAVDRIVGQVDSVILENQLNFAALTTIISGLGQAYGQFTTVPESLISAKDISASATETTAEAREAREVVGLERQLELLQDKVSDLSTTTRKIADFVNAAVNKKPIEKLRICGVDPKTIASDIVIDPAGPAKFTEGQNSTMVFLIKGGLQPYRAILVGSQVKGLTISQSALFGPEFVVEVSADTPVGQYSVYAADGLGHQKVLQVMVEAKPSSTVTE